MAEVRFDDRVAIVTGAGGGLGREHAMLLASRGARVVANDLGAATDGTGASAGPAERTVEEIEAHPELEALVSLPRSEAELRAAWDDWTIPERRVWLRRVLDHIDVAPATSHHRGSDVEARFQPVWKV